MSIMIRRTRRRAQVLAGLSVLSLAMGLFASGAAHADPNPEPKNKFYFTAGELPTLDGIPFVVSPDPEIPTSVADLRSGEPTCPAPALPPATDASSEDGYTLPVQIKLTNGIMLAGYSPSAAYWKQGVPFSLHLRGMTGWANVRVQLPSMKLLAGPGDVTICDGAGLGVAQPGIAPYPEWGDWAPWNDPWGWIIKDRADGSQVAVPPGVYDSYTYSPLASATPGRRLEIENVAVNKVAAKLTGLGSKGELEVAVDLGLDLDVVRGDHVGVSFPLGVSGTFSTAVKAPFAPPTHNVPWDIGKVPPAQHRSYLPSSTLPGAVEGSTATVGSTDVDIDVSQLKDANTDSKGLAASLYMFLYGIDPWGLGVVGDEPDNPLYYQWSNEIRDGTRSFFAPDRGVADVGVDMTIDRVGLPKGPPSGYGYD